MTIVISPNNSWTSTWFNLYNETKLKVELSWLSDNFPCLNMFDGFMTIIWPLNPMKIPLDSIKSHQMVVKYVKISIQSHIKSLYSHDIPDIKVPEKSHEIAAAPVVTVTHSRRSTTGCNAFENLCPQWRRCCWRRRAWRWCDDNLPNVWHGNYGILPSGKLTVGELENGHRNRGFFH